MNVKELRDKLNSISTEFDNYLVVTPSDDEGNCYRTPNDIYLGKDENWYSEYDSELRSYHDEDYDDITDFLDEIGADNLSPCVLLW